MKQEREIESILTNSENDGKEKASESGKSEKRNVFWHGPNESYSWGGEEHDVKEKKQECMHAQTRSNPAMSGSIR